MIGWALKQALLWGGIALLLIVFLDERPALFSAFEALPAAPKAAPASSPRPLRNAELVFRADRSGHVVVGAVVNGAFMHMLVDTGSTLVALGPRAAAAAGISLEDLSFSARVATAAGPVAAAPFRLREIRLGAFSAYDVRAEVLRRLPIPLLGMSFLGRLKSYEMRGGALILKW